MSELDVQKFAEGKKAANSYAGNQLQSNNTVDLSNVDYGITKAAFYPSTKNGLGENITVNPSVQVVTEQPEQPGETEVVVNNQTATTPTTYQPKYNWASGMSLSDAYNKGQHTQAEIIEDRRRWGKENNDPINYFEAAMLFPNDHDMNKTKAQNEEDIKRAARKEKMDQIGNFLAHLGNFVGTAAFGGLDIKPEDPVKFTERQRQLRDKTIALRNAYNKNFFENMAKQAADDRAQQNLELQKRKTDQADARLYLSEKQFDWKQKMDQNKFDLDKEKQEVWKAVQEGKMSNEAARIVIQQMNAETSRMNANTRAAAENRQQNGTTTTTTDSRGKVTTRVVKPGVNIKHPAAKSAQSKGRTKVNY